MIAKLVVAFKYIKEKSGSIGLCSALHGFTNSLILVKNNTDYNTFKYLV